VIYRAYGLTVFSEFPIPSLSPVAEGPANFDIHFEIGHAPRWALHALALPGNRLPTRHRHEPGTNVQFALTEHGGREFYELCYADGTRFVLDGRATRVWGEAGPGLTDHDVLVYFLGPIMGFVMRQRGKLALHASAVVFGDRAVAIMGPAGCGKSTTAAALALRGWPVLSEDVCALEIQEEKSQVLPSYPRICLWPDSVNMLFRSPEALPLIVSGWNKRFLPLDGTQAKFSAESVPLGTVYLFSSRCQEGRAPRIETISRKDALLQMTQNTYMNYLLGKEQRGAEFDAIARLLSQIKVRRVVPHSDPAKIPAMCELLEMDAAGQA
jgi:hypothetical protein